MSWRRVSETTCACGSATWSCIPSLRGNHHPPTTKAAAIVTEKGSPTRGDPPPAADALGGAATRERAGHVAAASLQQTTHNEQIQAYMAAVHIVLLCSLQLAAGKRAKLTPSADCDITSTWDDGTELKRDCFVLNEGSAE